MRNKLPIALVSCVLVVTGQAAESDIKVADPEANKPVTAALAVVPPKASAGKPATVLIKIRIFPLHHIYALNKSGSENTPTTLKLELPKGIALKGDWKAPEPKKGKDKSRVYEEEVVFRGTLAIARSVTSGRHNIKCEL